MLKTRSEKLWYIFQLVTIVYIVECNVSWIYFPLTTSLYCFINISFLVTKIPYFFGEQTKVHYLCKEGEIQLWLFKNTIFTSLLLERNPLLIKRINFKFEDVLFAKRQKKTLIITHSTNKVIINLKLRTKKIKI